jgi:hypothetical protein
MHVHPLHPPLGEAKWGAGAVVYGAVWDKGVGHFVNRRCQ